MGSALAVMSVSLLLVTLGIIHRSGVAAYLRRAVGRLALVLPLASTVAYVSYVDDPSLPWPEIYNSPSGDSNPYAANNAYQWQLITLYVYFHGIRMQSWAALSQYEACQEMPPCDPSVMNTPIESWTQLYNALNSDSRTSVLTAQGWMGYGGNMSYHSS